MGSLESALRDTFASRVRTPPAVDDMAGQAIRSAGRVHRRRRTIALAAVVTSVALAGVGVAALGNGPRTSDPDRFAAPTAPSGLASARLPIDVLTGREIRRSDGAVVSLALIPNPSSAWRTIDGWLVESAETLGTALWYVDGAGKQTPVVTGERVAVAPDGARIAWSDGGRVSVANRAGARLTTTGETGGTGTLGPIGFAAGGVVLGGVAPGGADTYDMWFPAKGPYEVGPRGSDQILAPNAAGTRLFGLSEGACLAEINPTGLTVLRKACGFPLGTDVRAYPSAEGRWLVLVDSERVSLVDLGTVWTQPKATAQWSFRATNAAWVDATSVVLGSPQGTALISTDDLTNVRHDDVTPDGSSPVAVIPRLG